MKPGDLVKFNRGTVCLYETIHDFKMAGMLRAGKYGDPVFAHKDEVAIVVEIGQFKYPNGDTWGCVPRVRLMDGRIGYCNEVHVVLIQEPDK